MEELGDYYYYVSDSVFDKFEGIIVIDEKLKIEFVHTPCFYNKIYTFYLISHKKIKDKNRKSPLINFVDKVATT
jgi:hypothetical protein